MLNCVNCRDARNMCGSVMSSTCVTYQGKLPDFFVKTAECTTININDVFEQANAKIDLLLSLTDVTTIDKKCLGFDTIGLTPLKLHQYEINAICGLDARLGALETTVNEGNIGAELVTIDLQCFTSENAACETAPNTYTLLSILNILIQENCDLRARVEALETA